MRSRSTRLSLALLVLGGLLLAVPAPAVCATEAMIEAGLRHLNQGEYAQALDVLLDVERRVPNPESVGELIGLAYLGLGYQHLRSAAYLDALAAFDESHAYLPDDVRLWRGRGLALYRLGQNGAAAAALQEAIGLDSGQPDLYFMLGQVHYAAGEFPQALDALQRAQDLGGPAEVEVLLVKVRNEWQLEQQMEQSLQGPFTISYADDDGQSAMADQILDVLNDAYAELGADLDYFPNVEVPVLLYGRQDFMQITNSPDWAGAVYDGKIRIPLGGLGQITPPLQAMLYHEYAHVLVRFLGRGRVPTWLNEGIAEVAGRRIHDPGLDHLQRASLAGELLSWEMLTKSFIELPEQQVPLAYEQSLGMVRFLVDQFGWHLLKDLLVHLGEGVALDQAMSATYADYGLNWGDIQREWLTTLN